MAQGRRLSTQILLSQLAVLTIVSSAGLALFAQEARHAVDVQSEQRALAVALATAAVPQVGSALDAGDPGSALQPLAERVRAKTGAAYVVIIDRTGMRHSHPNPTLIGQRVAEPLVARPQTGLDNGRLGRSANGKAPVVLADGTVVGEVSAGILESQLAQSKNDDCSDWRGMRPSPCSSAPWSACGSPGGSSARRSGWSCTRSPSSCRSARPCCTASGRAS